MSTRDSGHRGGLGSVEFVSAVREAIRDRGLYSYLVDDSITWPKIDAAGGIVAADLAANSVTTAKIADDAVTAPKLLIPSARGTSSVAKAIVGGAVTVYNQLDAAAHNVGGGITFTASSNTPFTIVTAGVYDVTMFWVWAVNAVGERITYSSINVGGGVVNTPVMAYNPTATGNTHHTLSLPSTFYAAGTTLGLAFFQNGVAGPGTLAVQAEMSVSYRTSI